MDSAAARAAGMDVLAMPIDTATAGAHDTEPTSTNGVHGNGGGCGHNGGVSWWWWYT